MELERENILIEEVLKHYIEKLKDKVAEALSNNIRSYSGFNSSMENNYHLKNVDVLERMLRQLNLDTDITKRTVFETKMNTFYDYQNKIEEIKNKVVDIFCPKTDMGRREYHENMIKAGKLADLIETLLKNAYLDGLNSRLLSDTTEIGKVEQKYIDNDREYIRRKLQESYNTGSNMLAMAMAAALNGNEYCKEVLKMNN